MLSCSTPDTLWDETVLKIAKEPDLELLESLYSRQLSKCFTDETTLVSPHPGSRPKGRS